MEADDQNSSARFLLRVPREAPIGLLLIGLIGLLSALIGFFSWFGTLGVSDVSTGLAVVMMGVAVAQAVTMVALVTLAPWAWYAAIGIQASVGVMQVARTNFDDVLVPLVVILYLLFHRDLFTV